MAEKWVPELRVDERADGCRLSLVGVTYGNGTTLQDATNDLMVRVYDLAMALRSGGYRLSREVGVPDPDVMDFLWEIGEIVSRGGDIRSRVLGIPAPRTPRE